MINHIMNHKLDQNISSIHREKWALPSWKFDDKFIIYRLQMNDFSPPVENRDPKVYEGHDSYIPEKAHLY